MTCRQRGGHLPAQLELSRWLFNGIAGTTDRDEAIRWLSTTAQRGHIPSATRLAFLRMEEGDLDNAFVWMARAASGGDVQAAAEAQGIASMLPPERLRAARQQVKDSPAEIWGQVWPAWAVP